MDSKTLQTIIGAAVWILIAAALGNWGKNRKIGFWPAFITGLLFWPLSIILILVFGPKEDDVPEKNEISEALEEYQRTKINRDQAILNQFKANSSNLSLNEKLEQLKQMKTDGLLSDSDYNNMKTNLLTGKGFS